LESTAVFFVETATVPRRAGVLVVMFIEGESDFVGSGGDVLAEMIVIVEEKFGRADQWAAIVSQIVLASILMLIESVDVSFDDEHLARSVVLPDVQNGWGLEPLNVPAGVQFCLYFEVILCIHFVLVHALHETRPIDGVHTRKVLADGLQFHRLARYHS
jgi:hypothetical protein